MMNNGTLYKFYYLSALLCNKKGCLIFRYVRLNKFSNFRQYLALHEFVVAPEKIKQIVHRCTHCCQVIEEGTCFISSRDVGFKALLYYNISYEK